MPSNDPSPRRPRVLHVGFGPTARSALESLLGRFEVVGLVREFDPQAPQADEVVALARSAGVPVYPESSLAGIERLVDQLAPDGVVVSSYHRILPARLVSKCPFVNVHYAVLPEYRGRANVNWAIINGEDYCGITIHAIAPGLDAGNILEQQRLPIGAHDTVTDLYAKLNAAQRELLAGAVQRYLDGDPGTAQDERGATYCCTRLPEDGAIDWSAPTRQVDALIRALTEPYPGALTYLRGEPLHVWRAEVLDNPPRYVGRIPGRVIKVTKANGSVDVLTGDGVLRLLEVQRPGEARRPAAEVITSVKDTLGLSAADLLARVQQLEQRLAALQNPRTPAS